MAVYTTIDNPELFFQTKKYTGTGSSNSITLDGSENMQPDWVWIKRLTAADHKLTDSVRGVTKVIESNNTAEESTDSNGLTAFNSDGFTVVSSASFNSNTVGFVSWNWKAGTSFTNDASSTGIGTIDSTGSVNETAGFSIVSYTSTGSNASLKHGLSTAPQWIIFKRRSGDTENWPNFHQALGNTHYMMLNASDGSSDSAARFNDTSPTSSVFTVGTSGDTNGGTSPFICYCFSERQGYSKFQSYTGNGNANGSYIHLGFKPAWVMIKSTAGGEDWFIWDNKRNSFNKSFNPYLLASQNNAEYDGSGAFAELLSNGFKIKGTSAYLNGSGQSYIYMAFAESPFVTSTGIPTTAK